MKSRARLAGHARGLDENSADAGVGVKHRADELAGPAPDVDHDPRPREVICAHHRGGGSRGGRALGLVVGLRRVGVRRQVREVRLAVRVLEGGAASPHRLKQLGHRVVVLLAVEQRHLSH